MAFFFDGMVAAILGVVVVLPRLLLISIISSVSLFFSMKVVIIANGLAVLVAPWVLLVDGPLFFTETPALVVSISALFAGLTIVLYRWLGMCRLFAS
jgi:hypothetical protein